MIVIFITSCIDVVQSLVILHNMSRNDVLILASYPVVSVLTVYAVINFLECTKERLLMEQEVQRAERLNVIGHLAASVAHEVRNPMTVVRGFMQILHSSNRISISEITSSVENYNEDHILFGKNVVFTGDLETIDRKDAMQKVVDLGGMVKSGVSGKTHYLVVGQQDLTLVGKEGLSTKEKKAYALMEQGNDIKVIRENEFLDLIKS